MRDDNSRVYKPSTHCIPASTDPDKCEKMVVIIISGYSLWLTGTDRDDLCEARQPY